MCNKLTVFLIVIPQLLLAQQPYQTDVLVIGGTTGGTAAGIQCARLGVSTIIVEQTPWLGGMLTAAGVSCTDGNHSLPSGLWQEFREALYRHYGTRDLFTGWVSNTCFEPRVGDSIFKAWAAREKNLKVFWGWYFDKVILKNGKVAGAEFINPGGQRLVVEAALTIDATDLGDAYASAGSGFDLGMEDPAYSGESLAPGAYPVIQDLTWAATLQDYGPGADRTLPRPEGYDPTLYYCCNTDAPCGGEPWGGDARKMLDYGKLSRSPGNAYSKYMLNWPKYGNDYPINVVALHPLEREAALRPARNKTLGFIYFIQTRLGYKNLGLAQEFPSADGLALMPYYREGRRLRGVVRMNVNHVIRPYDQPEALYRTGIAVGDYPVDHHHAPEKKAPEILFPKVPSFNVPLGALIPEKTEGLIVCEKGISVSNIVNGSTRLQPCVLLTGQAAGTLAALSSLQRLSPREVKIRSVQEALLQQKACLMPYVDVLPNDPAWAAIQRVGACGLLRGTGIPQGWANRTYFYPDSALTLAELQQPLAEWYPNLEAVPASSLSQKVTLPGLRSLLGKSVPTAKWKDIQAAAYGERPLLRREIAVLLDQVLDPFQREVDVRGHLVGK